MSAYQSLYTALAALGADEWAQKLPEQLARAFANEMHGDLARWRQVVTGLPQFSPSGFDLLHQVRIGSESDISAANRELLTLELQKLHPWRKGPYHLFGLHLDTEWRSDWKWDRLKAQIAPLTNRHVLDVGCGNGYHCWRMLGAGAKLVLGIDPTLLSVMQFQAISKLYGESGVYVLPLGIEAVPPGLGCFDTVFSMGVLYHRRSPIEHLLELKGCLRPGGEMVLETLVVEGGEDRVFMPKGRYAQMRNVWFLPSCAALVLWLQRCGFQNIRVADVTKTTIEEQRSTDWMRFNSLQDFLNPLDANLTCEGLPAPLRATLIANIN